MRRALSELASMVQGTVEGDPSILIDGVCGLEEARPGQLSFFGNPRYRRLLDSTRASAVLVGTQVPPRRDSTYIRVANPHLAFARLAQLFHPRKAHAPGIAPGAQVHPEARVDASATVMAGATVGANAVIGAHAVLYPGVYVGIGAAVGDDSTLHPNVTVADGCIVGRRCIAHASAVVGADGFGFAFDPAATEHVKIPQAGIVRLEDDVELGACSCVDRATTGETVVGRGSKIDNLVQIGHNCHIGPFSVLCAQVGLSGSTELGTGVMMGGQSGSAGHLRIGSLAKVGAQSGLMSDAPDGAELIGSPVLPLKSWLRSMAVFAKLPEVHRLVKELEKRLGRLEGEHTR